MAEAVGEPAQSIGERLRGDLAKAKQTRQQDLKVPGYEGGELHLIFRGIDDYTEVREVLGLGQTSRGLQDAQVEMERAIDLMLLSSVDSYAVVDGQRIDLGAKLGLPLHAALFPDGDETQPRNDREAVVMLFQGDTLTMMLFASQLDFANKVGAIQAELDISGNP